MQRKLFYIVIFILAVGIFSSIMPYPVFSNYTNITEKDMYYINNYNEAELQNINSQKTKLLNIDFSVVDNLFPIDSTFELIDIKTLQSFMVKRIGGKNHLDVEVQDQKLVDTIYPTQTWTRTPILAKLNDYTYVAASLSPYPHGYSSEKSQGHLCLHFKNSKTDGTNKIDPYHKKAIEKAKNKFEKVIE
ncbi:MAG: hypothetical protein E7375_03600 [Clostridiales bacterium]|nr:hypothetical protein [Clostridiales bacterium]